MFYDSVLLGWALPWMGKIRLFQWWIKLEKARHRLLHWCLHQLEEDWCSDRPTPPELGGQSQHNLRCVTRVTLSVQLWFLPRVCFPFCFVCFLSFLFFVRIFLCFLSVCCREGFRWPLKWPSKLRAFIIQKTPLDGHLSGHLKPCAFITQGGASHVYIYVLD